MPLLFNSTIRLKARTFFALNVVMMLWWVLDMTHRSTREAGRNNHGLLLARWDGIQTD